MHFPIVREYQEDLEGRNPENEIQDEPKSTPAGIWSRIIVPDHAPFFTKSLTVKAPNGQPLDLGVHYQIFSIMPRLTDLAGQPVACFIELLDPDLTDVLLDYHVVGEYSLIDNRMLQMIFSAVDDDRPVFWENLRNKPVVFPPHLHSHSLIRTVVCWQDTIEVMDLYLAMKAANGREPTQIRIDHFYDLLVHYISIYSDMLSEFLTRHMQANNEHGLTASQVGLEKVDNFETANSGNVLQARSDMHLTPQGLETIIETFGFDSSQYLKTGLLPISRFGNTNFIPANIDGSFEGFGGFLETAAITLESDGSMAYLWNRFDGRTTGLYYSVLTDSEDAANGQLLYTGYKYSHARINIDGAVVNTIAQGSGEDVILVGDKTRELYYIGVTNGSLDPAKHVYSPINLRALVDAIFSSPGSHGVSEVFPWVSIALVGQWIYIFHTASTGVPVASPIMDFDMRYKFFYRVLLSDVKAQIPVTPVRQNVTFMDAEGVQWNNSPYFRWCDHIKDGNGYTTKCLFPFAQASNNALGFYRSSPILLAENPKVPGQYAMKFLGAFYAAISGQVLNNSITYIPELNYNFDPNTGVMSLISKTNVFTVDFNNPSALPSEAYRQNQAMWISLFSYQHQGGNVLADGRYAISGSPGFEGFPRMAAVVTPPGSHDRHTTISRLWGLAKDFTYKLWNETLISPLASSINPRHLAYTPTGEFYVAAGQRQQIYSKLFFKTVSGRFAVRPEITNIPLGTVVARPLTGDIRPVNALTGMGMATVVFNTNSLTAYGVDVGDGAFCMGTQTKNFDRTKQGNAWPAYTANPNDVLLIANHNNRIEVDGSVTIVPTLEILYPENIVNALFGQIQFPGMATRFKIITICDPTYSPMSARAGWLPVCVCIQYAAPSGSDVNTLYSTFMTIQPTYAAINGRYQVTGFTVLDIVHGVGFSQAVPLSPTARIYGSTGDYETASSNHGPMRVRYYLNGNQLSVYMGSGIMSYVPSDAYSLDWSFVYNDRNTRRWSSQARQDTTTGTPTVCVTPDNGISRAWAWGPITGGAATVQQGPVNNALIGSVYPQTGWVIFFKTDINVIFNGRPFVLQAGSIDLRDIDPAPQNKTFYIYAFLRDGVAQYEVTTLKRLESQYQLWVGKVVTNASQILTIDRYNVIAMNGHRISELKRGNSIPASSGLVNEEGQIPWFYQSEILP